jgi:hypothetical protein
MRAAIASNISSIRVVLAETPIISGNPRIRFLLPLASLALVDLVGEDHAVPLPPAGRRGRPRDPRGARPPGVRHGKTKSARDLVERPPPDGFCGNRLLVRRIEAARVHRGDGGSPERGALFDDIAGHSGQIVDERSPPPDERLKIADFPTFGHRRRRPEAHRPASSGASRRDAMARQAFARGLTTLGRDGSLTYGSRPARRHLAPATARRRRREVDAPLDLVDRDSLTRIGSPSRWVFPLARYFSRYAFSS